MKLLQRDELFWAEYAERIRQLDGVMAMRERERSRQRKAKVIALKKKPREFGGKRVA